MQRPFSIFKGLAAFALFALVLGADRLLLELPDRHDIGRATAEVRYEPIAVVGAGPFRVHGAWIVSVDDPRFGGISALTLDGGGLLALSDRGVLFRLPRPGSAGSVARVDALPAGPGAPGFGRNRDSEALLRDPERRGWWVAFENHHELWLYDPGFARALRRVRLRGEWPVNTGIEGMAAIGGDLLLFPESGETVVGIGRDGVRRSLIVGELGRISDAHHAAGLGLLAIERNLTPLGFANALVRLEQEDGTYRVAARVPLDLGPFDNAEALAVERLPSGGARLWLMTDDNFQRPFRSILIGLDVGGR